MKKINLILITSIFVLFNNVSRVYADSYDLEVTCPSDHSNPCVKNTDLPLFNEKNWYPGSTATKIIKVTNEAKYKDCFLKVTTSDITQSPASFSTQLLSTINKDGKNIFDNTLQNFFDSSTGGNYLDFENIPNNGYRDFAWTITFDRDAGDEFQNANVKFDFDLNFTCEDDKKTFGKDNRGGGNGGNGRQGVVAGITTFFQNIINPQGSGGTENNNAENSSELTKPNTEKPKEEPSEVKGAATESPNKCMPLGWWSLLFVAQLVLLIGVRLLFNKNSKTLSIVLGVLITLAFAFTFWKIFCPVWDEWVSLLMALFLFV
jgi:hypothetical protein